ncbi:hypothetical protein [Bradyrhizobium sp. 76]|uniref:hypothetical protein n=1 Tax=Bradyrhizobium sp. 76 TaxID=2782680 RepID=UPI001FF73320|nr:hypothetical protein [Bradyrhizobium sp. 76]
MLMTSRRGLMPPAGQRPPEDEASGPAPATATLLVLLIFGSGPAFEFILPYILAMLMVPKGVTGQWLDGVYWTLAAETAFYGLVFCAMLAKKITLRHLAWGLTIIQCDRVTGVVVHDAGRLALPDRSDVSGAVRGIPADTWLLLCPGNLAVHSANRELTGLEQVAVAVTCLSGAAEIYFFASFFLSSIPAISDQLALVPIMVRAVAVLLIAFVANRNRRSVGIVSSEAPAYWRTLGLITYPFYLPHNVVGTAIIRFLVDAGLDAPRLYGFSWACLSWSAGLFRQGRAGRQIRDDANPFVFRTASETTAGIAASGIFSGAGPSAACPGKVNVTAR